jgi:hypothetical protein
MKDILFRDYFTNVDEVNCGFTNFNLKQNYNAVSPDVP